MKAVAIAPRIPSFRDDHAAEDRTSHAFQFDMVNVAQEHHGAPRVHLTPRQLEVLSLLCDGLPNKLICRQLNISPGTVKVHISCILRELGVSSRLQAVVSARRSGLDRADETRSPADCSTPEIALDAPVPQTSRQLRAAA